MAANAAMMVLPRADVALDQPQHRRVSFEVEQHFRVTRRLRGRQLETEAFEQHASELLCPRQRDRLFGRALALASLHYDDVADKFVERDAIRAALANAAGVAPVGGLCRSRRPA